MLNVLDRTGFRICILLIGEVFICEFYHFRRLRRLQVPKKIRVDFTINVTMK